MSEPLDLEGIEARLAAAGPLEIGVNVFGNPSLVSPEDAGRDMVTYPLYDTPIGRLLLHAPSDLSRLCEEVRALRAKLEELQKPRVVFGGDTGTR